MGFAKIGPGIVMAATGLGAGDLITATVAGKSLGITVIWALIFGVVLKFVLNEALARWQLITGETLLEAWCNKFPKWFGYLFLGYLIIWATLVGAALMAACGLAAHALVPVVSVELWACIHSLTAAGLVVLGRYGLVEKSMKVLILLMFATVLTAAFNIDYSPQTFSFSSPMSHTGEPGSWALALSVIGGVGGSVTLLCYSYWMKEKRWNQVADIPQVRMDLAIGYGLTAAFAIGIVLIAAEVQPNLSRGSQIVIDLADAIGAEIGVVFRWFFLAGFWGAVASSMLGVWQGVPYLFSDFWIAHNRKREHLRARQDEPHFAKQTYYVFLGYIALAPLTLQIFGKPVWLVLVYSVAGAFFMPILALSLLYLQKRYLPKTAFSERWSQRGILATLVVFVVFGVVQLIQ